LDIDGAEIPEQVPLLDDHYRYGASSVIGSIRGIKKQDGTLTGTLHFAESEHAAEVWGLVRDSHLTDISAGYTVDVEKSVYIEPRCSGTVNNKKVKNTSNRALVYRFAWKLQEASVTPIGADSNAKMRSESANAESYIGQLNHEERNMDPEELKKQEELKKLPENTSAPEGSALGNRSAPAVPEKNQIDEITTRKAQELVERSRTALTNITARAKLLQLSEEEYRPAINAYTFLEARHEQECLDKLFEVQRKKLADNQVPPGSIEGARVRTDAFDSFRKIAALSIYRTGGGALTKEEAHDVGASIYPNLTIQGAMRAFLEINGVRGAASMAPTQVYYACVDLKKRAFAITNGDLANVFLDVANKGMAKGYAEVNTVHEMLCGRDTSINFQPKYTIDMSAFGDPEELKTGESFPFTSMSDSKESVQLNMYGLAVNLDFKAIVNDSLGALVGFPEKLGQSMRRKEELLFWAFFYGTAMAGPTMGEDSKAMFHADHRNFIGYHGTGYGAPTTTTITAGKIAMKKQIRLAPDGRAETQYMELPPKYLVCHGNIVDSVTQRVLAIYDIDATANSNARENVPQLPWLRSLQPVSAPYLDAKMDAATHPHYGWYLIADPAIAPAINKVYLAGMESPTLRQKNSDVAEPLGTIWDIYHSVAFGQVNYRPVYANYGADQ